MRTFAVKNFERFQHYKDRKPPWVKLYRDIWSDRQFFRLAPGSKLLLFGMFTLASLTGNRIPEDAEWIASQLCLPLKAIDVEPLVDAGFLVVVQDASEALAGCEQVAPRSPLLSSVSDLDPDPDPDQEGETEGEPSRPAAEDALRPEDLAEAWNEHCAPLGLPAVRELSASRRKKALLRLGEHPRAEWWSAVFANIRASPFLRGLKGGSNGSAHPGWRATFDWLIENDTNGVKVFEGKYNE